VFRDLRQCRRDLRVAAVHRVHVPVGRHRRRVAHALHQVFEGRAGRRRQGLAGVAHVVEGEVLHPDLRPRSAERLAHRVAAHRGARTADEQAAPAGPVGDVLLEERQTRRGVAAWRVSRSASDDRCRRA